MATPEKNNRRQAIRKILSGGSFFAMGGMAWGGFMDESSKAPLALRPPGALPEKEFLKACTKCGICVESCPYDTLKLAKANEEAAIGTPYFKPREIPCYMCTDIPCVEDCPTDALSLDLVSIAKENGENEEKVLEINEAAMGTAVLNQETCLAFWGISCDACYRACPLIDEAITLDVSRNERTGKHAFMKPIIHNDICTGCGMCEHACITEETSIFILPKDQVKGKVTDKYIKGWESKDEARMDTTTTYQDNKVQDQSTLDYLNDDNLFDE